MVVSVALVISNTNKFKVTHVVKQGLSLMPKLLSFYLVAMLQVAFADIREGVYMQTRHEAELFSVAQFNANTRTIKVTVCEMLFADDSALVAHSTEKMQILVHHFVQAATQFSL